MDPIFGIAKRCFVSINTTTNVLTSGTNSSTTPTVPTRPVTPTNRSVPTTAARPGNTNQSNGNGSISLRLNTSRISGTAPLAVHFDASDTTTTIPNIYSFHDIRYSFDFGDERNQSWTIS